MREQLNFYIDGKWVAPAKPRAHDVINPANEEPVGRISLGSAADVDKAVAAARKAFETWSQTSVDERKARARQDHRRLSAPAAATWPRPSPSEMGAPLPLANAAQAPAGLGYLMDARKQLDTFKFEDEPAPARASSASRSASSA